MERGSRHGPWLLRSRHRRDYIAWQKRERIVREIPSPNWWGLAIMLWAGFQLYIATLGAELFLARTSFVISIMGAVLLLGGTEYLQDLRFSDFPAVLHGPHPGGDL